MHVHHYNNTRVLTNSVDRWRKNSKYNSSVKYDVRRMATMNLVTISGIFVDGERIGQMAGEFS